MTAPSAGPPKAHPVWYLAYPLLTLVLFTEVLLGDARLIDRDLLHYFLPLGASLGEAWRGGGSFLWDAGLDHGVPLVARWVSAAFYPTSLLHAALPPDLALTVAALLHLPLAAVAAFRLALRHTASVPAAWIGGLAFAFSGYLLTMVGSGTYLYAAALLPLGLLALHRLQELPSAGRCLQLSCVLALQVFVADPNTLYAQVVFCFPLVLLLYRPPASGDEEPAPRSRAVALTAAAGLLALGLSFCQLWPAVELAGLSERAGGFAYADATTWSLHPLRLAELVAPGVFGRFSPDNSYWMPSLLNAPFSAGKPWATALHVGLLPLCGVALLSARSQRRTVLLWGAVVLLFLVLAMGSWTPLFKAAYALPGIDRFRYPEKYLLFVTLGLCVLGAAGLGRLLEDRARGRAIAVLGVLAALLVGGRVTIDAAGDRFAAFVGPLVDAPAAAAVTAAALQRCGAVALALIAVLALRRFLRLRIAALLLATICVVDLLSAGLPLRVLGGADWLGEQPAICSYLERPHRGLRPVVWRSPTIPYPASLARGDPAGLAERQRRWEWRTLKPNIGSPGCVRHADAYGAPELVAHGELLDALVKQPGRLLQVTGVRHVIARPGSLPRGFPLRRRMERLGVSINDAAGLPFAHPVGRVAVATDRPAAMRRIADPAFPLQRAAVFEGDAPQPIYKETARRQAALMHHQAGAIELELDFDEPGYLVVLESHYPGWQAALDGEPRRLYRANGAFLGLRVPRGKHQLMLTFAPRRQVVGLWVSGASLLVLLVVGGVVLVRRRRPDP